MIYPVICPYCQKLPELVTGATLYPHRPELAENNFWLCQPCDAYVGCHRGTTKALGTMADKTLRVLRMKVHEAFDPLWKSGKMTRLQAYHRLSIELQIPKPETHVALFDETRCLQALSVLKKLVPHE